MKPRTYDMRGPGIHEYELEVNCSGTGLNYIGRVLCLEPFTDERYMIGMLETGTRLGAEFAANRIVKKHRKRAKRAGFDSCYGVFQ